MRIHIFMGKGGVGKTTTAAAFSLLCASKGLRTLVVSLDPAHNLGDVFDTKLNERPREIVENLWASEIDFDKAILDHLKQLTNKIKDMYGYLRVLNLDKYIDVLKHSPGIEEYATLEKMKEVIQLGKDYDVIVFDTPPTGLTLRTLVLPFINRVWLEKLMDLRRAILDRRKALLRALGEKPRVVIGGKVEELAVEEEEDPIFKELTAMYRENEEMLNVLRSHSVTSITMVVNPEVLPVLEAKRAMELLKQFGMPIKNVVVNKVLTVEPTSEELKLKIEEQKRALEMIEKEFSGLRIVKVPMFGKEPRGIDMLKRYARYIEPLLQ